MLCTGQGEVEVQKLCWCFVAWLSGAPSLCKTQWPNRIGMKPATSRCVSDSRAVRPRLFRLALTVGHSIRPPTSSRVLAQLGPWESR